MLFNFGFFQLGETDKLDKLLSSAPDSAPKIVAVKNGKVVNFAIVADGSSVLLNTVLTEEAVFHLLAFYYVMDCDYPCIYG